MQSANSRLSHLPPRSELAAALASCRGAFIGTALISGMSNILTLAGAMFMLEIYDRVLPSHSMPTLVGLARSTRRSAAVCTIRWYGCRC
jgi:ABC-type protease/lipase transport system fused ATPase/permease subunit